VVPYETHKDSLYVYKKSGNVADHLAPPHHLPIFTLFHGVINK